MSAGVLVASIKLDGYLKKGNSLNARNIEHIAL